MDPITIALLASKGIQAGVNLFRGDQDIDQAESDLAAIGGVPNYTLSGDYDRMVNMALNAPQTGVAMAERAYADQAAAAGAYGSRGLGSLNAATRNLATTTAGLEAQRLQGITSALGTRAGAEQSVLNANTAQAIKERDFARNMAYQNLSQAQATRDAGLEGLINIGAAGVAGVSGGLQAQNAGASFGSGFGAGFESFYNPTPVYNQVTGEQIKFTDKGGRIADKGASFVTPGEHNHDTNEFLISRMVKTANGTKLVPMGVSTGNERHEENADKSMTITTKQQDQGLHDAYLEDKKKGRLNGALGRAAKMLFEQNRFKR